MSIQPTSTPAQQTVHDLIQAWRETSGIPVPQHDSTEIDALNGRLAGYETAPGECANTSEGLAQPSAAKPSRLDVST